MNPKNNYIYIIILVLVVGGVVFAGYKFFHASKNNPTQTADQVNPNSSARGNFSGGNGTGQRGQGRGNFSRLHGTIQSVSDSTIVMKADDGSTKNITVSSTTRISEQVNGQMNTLTISDLKNGDEINVMGGGSTSTNSTSVTARMIIKGTFTPPQRGSYQQNGGGYQGGGNYQQNNGGNDSSPNGASGSSSV